MDSIVFSIFGDSSSNCSPVSGSVSGVTSVLLLSAVFEDSWWRVLSIFVTRVTLN